MFRSSHQANNHLIKRIKLYQIFHSAYFTLHALFIRISMLAVTKIILTAMKVSAI